MITKHQVAGLAVLALATGAALTADAATSGTLDFSGDICGGGACADTDPIDQSYGDISGELDVIYDGDLDQAGDQGLLYWQDDYGILSDVAYNNENNTDTGLQIVFDTVAGIGVRITGFDIAAYAERSRDTSVVITDLLGGATLLDTGTFDATDCEDDTCSYIGNWESQTGLVLTFGPDAYNTGIDNIDYETFGTAAVPLPGGLPLALAGLGAFALLRRRPG